MSPVIGNMNPVTLVSSVASRNSAVEALSRCEPSIPNNTVRPVTIATRLLMTCRIVKT